MQFSKTLHWDGGRAVESVVNSHANLRNGIGESRTTCLLSHMEIISGKRLNGAA